MKIILVNRWYPPYTGFGGVAAYDTYLAHALAKLGHEVAVLAARWTKDAPALQQDGPVRVMRLLAPERPRLKRLPVFSRYLRPVQQSIYSLSVARALNALRGFDRPDVVEFAEVNAEGYHYLRQRNHIPAVARCHTPTFVLRRYYAAEEMPFDTAWTAAMEADSIRRANLRSAPSRDMADVIAHDLSMPADAFTVIPNALDVDLFRQPPRQRQPDDAIIILHVGRLERVKGVEVLARAFIEISEQTPRARLVFVGDDRPDGAGSTWRTRLERQFAAHGLQSRVQFTGGIDQQELLRWYARADLAVVPSMLYESFSYTCAQAMAAGLPVIATRIGGVPETVGDCGLIVEPGDSAALAEALLELLTQPNLRQAFGQQACQRAAHYFDAEIVAKKTLDLYVQAISHR